MKKTVLILCMLIYAFPINAQEIQLTIEELQNDTNNYLSSVNSIKIDQNDKITIVGERKKNHLITGTLVNEMISIKDTGYPNCAIMHSQDEYNAYCTYDSSLRVLPEGHDGGLAVLQWQRNKFSQNVFIGNMDRSSKLAHLLFESDCYLKKMIMNKKWFKVRKMESFPSYVYMHYSALANNGEFGSLTRFKTVFYFIPDTIEIRNNNGIKELVRTSFKLVPIDEYKDSTIIDVPHEWSKKFNKNYSKIMNKHPELKKIEDVFSLYYAIKKYRGTLQQEIIGGKELLPVPEKIKSLKFADIIEVPSPLINKPGRMFFCWILLSGAISFDYHSATIIESNP